MLKMAKKEKRIDGITIEVEDKEDWKIDRRTVDPTVYIQEQVWKSPIPEGFSIFAVFPVKIEEE